MRAGDRRLSPPPCMLSRKRCGAWGQSLVFPVQSAGPWSKPPETLVKHPPKQVAGGRLTGHGTGSGEDARQVRSGVGPARAAIAAVLGSPPAARPGSVRQSLGGSGVPNALDCRGSAACLVCRRRADGSQQPVTRVPMDSPAANHAPPEKGLPRSSQEKPAV